MKAKIESGIPIPKKKRSKSIRWVVLLKAMKPGESFQFDARHYGAVSKCASNISRRSEHIYGECLVKFETHTISKTIKRIWRIK